MHTSIEHLRDLFGYLHSSDLMLLEEVSKLPDEEYYKERGISLGSIHKLMAHSMAAERVWLSRWKGATPTRIENESDFPTKADLARAWPQVHAEMLEFLGQQTPQALAGDLIARSMGGEPYAIALGHTMLHVVDHGTYHRGQLNSMIKQAGGKPVPAFYALYQKRKNDKA
jgi:uncharacterized damage-inducible protein DinB